MFFTVRLPIAALIATAFAALLPVAPWPTILVVNVIVVGVAFADSLRAADARKLQLSRTAPNVAGVREEFEIRLTLHNPLKRALGVSLRDATPPSAGRAPKRQRAVVPPGAWWVFSSRMQPVRRGWTTLGPVTVRTLGPLGLGGRQRDIPLEHRIKVYPALPGRHEVELRVDRARMLQSGVRSSAYRGGGTEFDSVREYVPDDELRRINWRATARAGKTITNLYREERNQQVVVLYDTSRMMAGNVAGLTRFEHALDAGFAVSELAARVGDHVGMVAFGSDVRAMIGPRGGRVQPKRILDRLFDLDPVLEAPDYKGAFASLLGAHRRRSLMVILTELTEVTAMETLFAALPVLLKRHLVVVGSISDNEVLNLARRTPLDSQKAYARAAASKSLLDRDRAASRLRALGVGVEDRPPGELSGALADRYLRIKSAGRL